MKAVLDLENAADYLDMTVVALRELVKRQQIPYKHRGDKLIFLVEDLKTWARALPGLSIHEALAHLKDSAIFTTTPQTNPASNSSIETQQPTPITLRRGARTHVSSASQE